MIESLHIEDLGVIASAELHLSPGLTALTGETGAGKTMVLTSLGLLLGQRAEATIVRTGAERTLVEGAFLLDPASRAAERAREAGAELDEDLLLASRTVPMSGRSRAHLGGHAVPSAVLTQVGGELVSVHGQADQLRLRTAAAQRQALDSMGGAPHRELCRAYGRAYRAWVAARDALEAWEASAATRSREVAQLRAWLEQIEKLDPQPGEDHELTTEASRLDHAEDLRIGALRARVALAGEESQDQEVDALAGLASAQRSLEEAAGLDAALTPLAQRLAQLSIDASDVAAELDDYLTSLEADPARLAWVQDRRAQLARACREIGTFEDAIDDVDALLAFAERSRARLEELDGPVDTATELRAALTHAEAALSHAREELTASRSRLAQDLSERVTAELAGLQMAGARLEVHLEPLETPGPTGGEAVSLALVSHPGAPALPLGKGASGGELSRIMLALEVVLADAEEATVGENPWRRTLIFDEIDAGVGGRAAGEIGRRLARLARSHQVVVVTHLAQVAAWADKQLVVRKHVVGVDAAASAVGPQGAATQAEGGETGGISPQLPPGGQAVTRTEVIEVQGEERERELARMLSGHDDSATAIRHAAELLAEARVAQSRP